MAEAWLTDDGTLAVTTAVVGLLENNAYLAACPRTGRAVLIDPADDAARILEASAGLSVQAVLVTHGHPDHVAAAPALRRALGAPVYLHPADAPAAGLVGTRPLADGDEVRFGGAVLRVIHTPGHTPGSVCFHGGGCLFSGDTLFPDGPGATGDPRAFAAIMASLRERLFTLPDETRVLPGHGPGTTIGAERPALDDWERRGW
ncbi:MAG: beta-lactamase domain protein [Actinobacteria bacterium]|nr:beta-lactamase domain protein [Actinomycetota bacterium]